MASGIPNLDARQRAEDFFDLGLRSTLNASVNMKSRRVRAAVGRVTLAQLNAGVTILPNTEGRQYMVLRSVHVYNGTFTTATLINFGTTEASPTVIVSTAIANATTGTVHGLGESGTSTVTVANHGIALAKGYGLQFYKTGSDAAGGTDIYYFVEYCIEN